MLLQMSRVLCLGMIETYVNGFFVVFSASGNIVPHRISSTTLNLSCIPFILTNIEQIQILLGLEHNIWSCQYRQRAENRYHLLKGRGPWLHAWAFGWFFIRCMFSGNTQTRTTDYVLAGRKVLRKQWGGKCETQICRIEFCTNVGLNNSCF